MKKQTRNILFIAGGGLLLIAVVTFWWLWKMMSQPMYVPGGLKSRTVNILPEPGDSTIWHMDKDIHLYHFAEGAGRNVLLVHGGPGIPWSDPVAGFSKLADRYRLNYYDQRGCGRSSRPFDRFASTNFYQNMVALETKLGIAAQLKDIERIRLILGEKKLVLIGHSYGAFLAAMYAAEYPENVEALVLIAPADLFKFPPPDGGLFEQVKKVIPPDMKVEYADWQKEYLDFNGIFNKSEADLQEVQNRFVKYYTAAVEAKGNMMPESADAPGMTGGWMVYAQYFSMGRKHDYREALTPLTVPVLVLHGANDLQPESASKTIAGYFKNSKFEVIQGAGHFPFSEQPEAFAEKVKTFLDEKLEK